jgi:iron complex outermembrane receptor protein
MTAAYEGATGGVSRWAVEGSLAWYRLVTDRDRFATESDPRRVGRSDVRSHDYGLRLSAGTALRGLRLQGGLDLNGRPRVEAVGTTEVYATAGAAPAITTEVSIDRAARHDLGAYASIDGAPRRWLLASLGGRVDHVTTRNRGGHFGDRHTAHDAFSGFAAVNAGPWSGITITAQVGRGFRDPTLSDRYFRGVSGRGFVTGEPELRPEKSVQYDLALRRTGRVRTAAYLYRYRIDGLVERYQEGSSFFFRNRGRGVLQGAELEAQADLGAGFGLEIAGQVAHGEADDGSPLADVWRQTGTVTARKRLGERGSVLVRAHLRAADDEAGPTEKPTAAHALFDAAGSWPLMAGLEARVVLKNLTNRSYRPTPDEVASLGPGRSLLFTLGATF